MNKPESPSNVIDVDAVEDIQDIQDNDALRASESQQMEAKYEASASSRKTVRSIIFYSLVLPGSPKLHLGSY